MSLGKDETVAVRFLRIARVNVLQLLKIQISKNIRRSERSARMAGFCGMYGGYNVLADFICNFLQFQIFHSNLVSCNKTTILNSTLDGICPGVAALSATSG